MPFNPCQRCGACCAVYKVFFPSSETDAYPGGTVPHNHTLAIDVVRSIMRGTESAPRRCVALRGVIGEAVSCAIYDTRPSACQHFEPAWMDAGRGTQCNRARSCYGLMPFSDY